MKAKFPEFGSDEEAEIFLETADLSAYAMTDMVPVRFELRRTDASVGPRMPESPLDAVRVRPGAGESPPR
ncbi:CopG family antitoxin [Methylobacterium sp. NEAU 140]|uniref:CopG family antitoxin n=1 Tax=Methylobacterium sp. NEAU 140 TaxID=3064945 RepID=UPI00273526A0|nr:CopG family antitoxin [Methylobacterium sp. NEAU 140]MDP4023428.1 CopG family antitoxin [Methylobacterium sp. NEAU 140]